MMAGRRDGNRFRLPLSIVKTAVLMRFRKHRHVCPLCEAPFRKFSAGLAGMAVHTQHLE